MEKFKAYRIREAGKGVSAAFEDVTLDELDPGEVVIRIAYSDVNYKDALAATGKGKIIRRFPCIGGIDCAGTVVSSSDARFKKGDAVICTSYDFGVSHDGGYAHFARVPADWVVRMPKGMSHFEAMAHGTAGYTAALAVTRMEENGLTPAKGPVIVTGATGGVGSIAVAVLAKLGYEVVALTGKAAESDYLTSIGAKRVQLRDSLDLAKIRPLDKATWAGAVDNLGGDVLAWIASTMAHEGTIASVGLAASHSLNTTVMPFILRGACLLGVDSGYTPMPARQKVWDRLAGDMRVEGIERIARTIPFASLPTVFDDFMAGKAKGRVVVDLSE